MVTAPAPAAASRGATQIPAIAPAAEAPNDLAVAGHDLYMIWVSIEFILL